MGLFRPELRGEWGDRNNAQTGPPVIWLGAIEKNLVSIARCPGPELRVLDRLIARLMVQVEVNVVSQALAQLAQPRQSSSRSKWPNPLALPRMTASSGLAVAQTACDGSRNTQLSQANPSLHGMLPLAWSGPFKPSKEIQHQRDATPPISWNSPSKSPVSGRYCHPARFCQDAFEVLGGPEISREAWQGGIGRRNSNVDTLVRVIEPGIAFVVEVHRVYWSKHHPIH
ncbi:hypothetical protein BN1708_007209 [Verticillium longisporum]|uniref:Uncharacterized protein n=2 Tax=Verticillium longisporum TaxID=100787 RepID=A0A0G4MRI5_VERLO|nr:hypothetical protein BN1708_007209 [Verticillium longisporum]